MQEALQAVKVGHRGTRKTVVWWWGGLLFLSLFFHGVQRILQADLHLLGSSSPLVFAPPQKAGLTVLRFFFFLFCFMGI